MDWEGAERVAEVVKRMLRNDVSDRLLRAC